MSEFSRRITVRCVEDDLDIVVPPAPETPWRDAPAAGLSNDFLTSTRPAESDKYMDDVAAAAGRKIFRWRFSDRRGTTWYEQDARDSHPRLRQVLADVPVELEWLLNEGPREDRAAYESAVKLATDGALVPSRRDYARLHAEFADQLGSAIEEAVISAVGEARATPGVRVHARAPGGYGFEFLVEIEEVGEALWIAVERTLAAIGEPYVQLLVATAMGSDGDWAELDHPESFPGGVPGSYRVFISLR